MSNFRPGGIIWLPEGADALDAGKWLAGLKPWAPPKVRELRTLFCGDVRLVCEHPHVPIAQRFWHVVKESPLP